MSEHGSAKVRGSLFLVRGGLWLLEKNQRKTLHSMHRGGAGTILHEDVDPIQGTLENTAFEYGTYRHLYAVHSNSHKQLMIFSLGHIIF